MSELMALPFVEKYKLTGDAKAMAEMIFNGEYEHFLTNVIVQNEGMEYSGDKVSFIIDRTKKLLIEKMSFKELAKKARPADDDPNKKRKRFGKSIGVHAPAAFVKVLDRKLRNAGGQLLTVDTTSFKASQYNHVKNEYIRKKLSQRYIIIKGKKVQRDLYSAYLLKNSKHNLRSTCRMRYIKDYNKFLVNHDYCIKNIKESGMKLPACCGIKNL